MRPWTRRHTLIVGVAVILLTNTVALLGAAWNRSGDAESGLTLTQRELRRPYWGLNRENSGIALALIWRTPVRESANATVWSYPGAGGPPSWLDQAKMEGLGFEFAAAAQTGGDDGAIDRQLGKEVLLVLEMDGAAYQQSLQRVRRHTADEEAIVAAGQNGEEFTRRVKEAHDRLKKEEQDSSRLFVVDAGLDVATLRAKYPDRARYAIVRGQVRPWRIIGAKEHSLAGYIEHISIESIHVPFEFLGLFEQLDHRAGRGSTVPTAPFEATVTFGQRLEPWITGVSITPKQPLATTKP